MEKCFERPGSEQTRDFTPYKYFVQKILLLHIEYGKAQRVTIERCTMQMRIFIKRRYRYEIQVIYIQIPNKVKDFFIFLSVYQCQERLTINIYIHTFSFLLQ